MVCLLDWIISDLITTTASCIPFRISNFIVLFKKHEKFVFEYVGDTSLCQICWTLAFLVLQLLYFFYFYILCTKKKKSHRNGRNPHRSSHNVRNYSDRNRNRNGDCNRNLEHWSSGIRRGTGCGRGRQQGTTFGGRGRGGMAKENAMQASASEAEVNFVITNADKAAAMDLAVSSGKHWLISWIMSR